MKTALTEQNWLSSLDITQVNPGMNKSPLKNMLPEWKKAKRISISLLEKANRLWPTHPS